MSHVIVKGKLGFIGLGKMGKPMARDLLHAGFPLTVYNRSATSVQELAKEGATPASTPREVGSQSDIVLLSLPSNEAVTETVLGDAGVAKGMAPEGIVVDTSTIDPQLTREISGDLQRKGIRFLDAPVSGGPEGAENASLTFMVGGNSAALDACKDVLEVLGRNVFYMGESGAGQTTKLVNQLLVAAHTVAAADAVRFASAMKLDHHKLLEAIKVSAGDSFVFRRAAPKMTSQDFGSGWQTYLMYKDLGLIMKTAENNQIPLTVVKPTLQVFAKAMHLGLAKVDSASIVKVPVE